jgi:hypothetical protein
MLDWVAVAEGEDEIIVEHARCSRSSPTENEQRETNPFRRCASRTTMGFSGSVLRTKGHHSAFMRDGDRTEVRRLLFRLD